MAATTMPCPDGMEQESAYFKAPAAARSWAVAGDDLALLDASGAPVARFTAVDLR